MQTFIAMLPLVGVARAYPISPRSCFQLSSGYGCLASRAPNGLEDGQFGDLGRLFGFDSPSASGPDDDSSLLETLGGILGDDAAGDTSTEKRGLLNTIGGFFGTDDSRDGGVAEAAAEANPETAPTDIENDGGQAGVTPNVEAALSAVTPATTEAQCSAGVPAINAATVNLIQEFEGFVASPEPDPIGLPTVGFGHLCQRPGCSEVTSQFSLPLSRNAAAQLLQSDVQTFTNCLSRFINDSVTLNENQFGALTAFAFNPGCGAVQRSTLLKRLNAGENPNTVAAQELPKFNKTGGRVLAGLTRRRAAEVALFQTPSHVVALPVCN